MAERPDVDAARAVMGLPAPPPRVPGLPVHGPAAALALENIGDEVQWNWKQWGAPIRKRCWVARVRGLHPRFKLDREFLWGEKDYSRASSTGNRGVFFHFRLRPGYVYHVCAPKTWGDNDVYYGYVADGEIVRLSEEEVVALFSEAGDA